MTWLVAFVAALPYADQWANRAFDAARDKRAKADLPAKRDHERDLALIKARGGEAK